MTDPSDQLAPPALTMDVDLGSSNGHLGSGDELPYTGDAHVAVDIEPSALPLTLITHGVMDTCGEDKTIVAGPRDDDLVESTNCTRYDSWSKTLADVPELIDLPTDRPRPTRGSVDLSEVPIILDAQLTQLLKRLAMDRGMDLGIVVMTGWGAVLSRLSGQDDIIVGFHSDTLGQSHTKCSEDRVLPLRMDLSGEPNSTQLLCRTWEMVSSVVAHQGLPSSRISDVDNPSRRANVSPVFQVVFQWQSQERRSSTLKKAPTSALHLDLQLHLQESDNEVKGSMQFSSALFDTDTIKRHAGYLVTTLRSMAEDPTRPVTTFDILSPAERRLVLDAWNNISETYPGHLCLHQLFETQAAKTPDAIAIVHDGEVLSYSELNSRANRLAHHLIELGVRLETRVAICVDRTPGMIVGILAIMKAGGAYVPIDPNYAGSRVNDILQDASPTIAVADKTGESVLKGSSIIIVDPNTLTNNLTSNPMVPELTSRNLAYIIYTSGSTGNPKGVMIEHGGVVNLAQTRSKFCGIHQDSRVLQFASFGFDMSVWEVVLPLTNGACLFLPPAAVRQDRKEFWEYVIKHGITLMMITPSYLQDGKDIPKHDISLTLVLGGEALNQPLLKNLVSQGYTVMNEYGPTEITVSAIAWKCPPDFAGDAAPIGRPIGNKRVYILDKYQQPVPFGAPGEMYLGGVGVARGYLNRPELSADRFLKDPFTGDGEARMYRTGDLARYLPDGNIAFLGRNDDQIKIRGFRVEPGEIEARLSDHPFVEKAAVFAMGEGSSKRLVAYVVAKPQDNLVHTLRSHLALCLPEYMVPAAIVRLVTLPLTASGKIDRKALPEPDSSAFAREVYVAPRGEIETSLARIWEEVLSLDRVSRNDDFFTLGGHSLLVVRMIERLHHVGLSASVSTIYGSPVLNVLARAIKGHLPESIPPNLIPPGAEIITPEMLPLIDLTQGDIDRIIEQTSGGQANIADIYSLSPLQDGILFHHLHEAHGDPYLLSSQLAFESRELLDHYLQAFQKVVDRHDILRTAFIWKSISTPAQVVWRYANLSVQELVLDPANGPIITQLDNRFHPNHYRIDLTQAPLLRFIVSQDTGGRWVLYQLVHHLIRDHSATEMMNHEVEQILSGQEHTLPAPQPFRNAIAQARRSSNLDVHEKFFKEMLGDIDEPKFPFGISEINHNGADITESHSILPQDLNNRLRSQAKEMGVSMASLCHVAWAQVLARTSGQEHVIFGTVLLGADQGSDHAMGLSINTLPFRCDVDSKTVRECVRLAHIRLASLLEHKYASLPLAQKCSGVPAGTPLFSSIMNYLHTSLPSTASFGGSSMEYVRPEEHVHFPGIEVLGGRERTNYPFTLTVEDLGKALGLTIQTIEPTDPARVSSYMKRALENLVSALESNPDMETPELNVLPLEEYKLLTQGFNSSTLEYPQHQTIHHLFEQQVERTPQATALVFNGQSMTYAELNERANRLAHRLIELGVQPDNRVAICVQRSFAMIIGVLAVLKSGGAYVPLDPTYPVERLVYILDDAAPSIALVDTIGRTTLDKAILHRSSQKELAPMTMLGPSDQLLYPGMNPIVPTLAPHHLAYIVYTSGSTGKPKGVMIEHRGVVSYALSRLEDYRLDGSSRVLQFSSLYFDLSVMESFTAFYSGASLYLIEDRTRLDRQELWGFIEQNSITLAILPPAILQECKSCPPLSTKLVLVSCGEELPASLLRALHPLVPNGIILNEYGPSETAIGDTAWKCPDEGFDGDIVPIGRPLANKRIYILDKYRRPSPLGAIGELYIGGVGVARGYLNRPELTSKVFLSDPFSDGVDARMYKTGDQARYLPDGNIVYLGRNDQQVKIRGFRIELGEIESRLVDHPLVETATVVAIGESSDKRLVAYVAGASNDDLARILRSYLTSCLPDYMVPAAIVRLDSLPLTSNGKIDRRTLPAPDGDALARQAYEEPQEKIEIAVAQIWSGLLSIERVSRNDNFFALGGHSLLAVRLMNRIDTLGAQMPLSAIFASPHLSSFAELVKIQLDKGENTTSIINPISRDGDLPLSFSQQRMWFLTQMEGVSETYHIPLAIRFRGNVNHTALQRALDTIFSRHEALRSVFVNVEGHPRVRLLPPQSGIPIRHEDLRGRQNAETELERMSTDEANTPFDLERGPLIRVLMVHLDNNEHYLMLTQHHIVSDGWSMGILQRELSTLYGAYSSGQSDPLPPLAIQYPDYASWQKEILTGSQLDSLSSYWRTTLSDAPILLNLPTDRPRPLHQSFAGSHVPIMLDAHVTRRLKQLCKDHGVTLYMVILAAWSSVLSRLSGQDDIVIGSPVANRSHRQIEPLIGFFVNTLALRIDHSGDPSVKELIDRVRRTTLDAQAHQDLPFEQVVEIIQPPRSTSHSPLFQVMFALQNNESPGWDLPGTEALETDLRYNIAKFDLNLGLYELDDTITGVLEYSTTLFDHSTMERHAGYLCRMIQEMVMSFDCSIGSVEILTQDERDLVLHTWSGSQQDYPSHLCIHHLFEQQVERSPQATALVFNDQSMTYAELNERSNQLAHHLIELGVRPDATVAICVERSPAMIVAVLAVIKAGGAYVPLDPTYPKDRLTSILEDAAPLIVLADDTGRTILSEAGSQIPHQKIMIDPNVSMDTQLSNPKVLGLTSSHLAYVIYTSGSTGRPKGVMIEHYGVVNHLSHRLGNHSIDESSRVLQFTSLNFDVSVMEIFSPLSSGGIMYLPDNDTRLDISQLWNYIQEHSINVASLTSGVLQSSKMLPPLSTPLRLNLVGEPLPPSLLHTLYPLFPKGSKIVNEYGPTEATIMAATWDCPIEFSGDNVPIGRPTANMRIYILDKNCHLVPQGAIGEMYIGGVGIARGYLKRPELTSQVFLQDPFSDDPNARMYKTGDLGRYLPDGNIVCLGRNDHQVKIRGFRIELGEIQARLSDHPLVEMATVVVMGDGSHKKLMAYVTAVPDDDLIHTLRSYLSSRLPDYMVPAAIVRLDTLPLTSNGKIDRKALPVPDDDAYARHVFESPQGVIETTVARIWEELLNIDKVSRNDNFFALGGHSLLAVQLMNRIAIFGTQLPLCAIFVSPSLSSFAECVQDCLDKGENTTSIITSISRDGDLPLSFSQQRMWFLSQMEGVSETYHMPSATRFRGDVNHTALQRALETIFSRHEALRSVFVNVDGHPRVRLLPPQSRVPIRYEDLRGRQYAETELERISTDEANTPFDLERGPLIRALMVHLDNNEHYLMLTQHHIVSDGWSMGILQRELITLYGAYSSGQSDPLPPLAIQYPDYAAWQKEILTGSQLDSLSSYWRTTLSDAPILLNLPTDRPRPLHQSFAGSHVPIMLDAHVTRRLKQLCKDHGVTLYMVILAAWSSVLSRLSGQDDIVIGSPVANRNHRQIEPLIGFFVNTLALRIDHSGDPSVKEVIDRVRRATLDAQAHQDLPFEQVVEIIQPPRSTSHSPLFQVMFAWQNNESSEWNLPGTEQVETDLRYDIAKFDINLGLYELDDTITGGIGYSTALFDHSTMERHVGYLCTMIHEMVVGLDRPIGSVEILAQDERELVLQTWNATQQDYPSHLCIHHLFEQQVEQSPQATALVFDGLSLTYSELNDRANQLAHRLVELGAQPDTLVAICVERSFAMIVGMMAILKAGGAYVPLDPSYASSRLRDIFMDASPSIVIADESGRTALGRESLAVVTIVDPNTVLDGKHDTTSDSQLGDQTPNPQIAGLTSGHLAYVIYTSGSTGKPKGVLIEHQGVVNLIHPRPEHFGIHSESRILQFTSLGFDHSVSEIFSALAGGGSLHLIRDDVRLDQRELWSYISRNSITHVSLTPSLLQDTKDMPTMSVPLTFIIMGETLSTSVISHVYSVVPNGRVINEYGPTETSVAVTIWNCPRDFNGDIAPVGRPIPNKTIYILDTRRQLVPVGAIGEIYIGGMGVARGYLNRPELTSQVFLRDPFSDDPNARMYKTGDLGRYLPDGNVVYLGRNDHQVKIRGFRIELGEIEARIVDHPLVKMATVVVIGEGSDKTLVAYVAAVLKEDLVHTLRSYLALHLPDYMVPTAIVRLDSLPLTASGKIDRKALPEPNDNAFARHVYKAPQGKTENDVAQIWEELLNIERVGRNDNFFALGGHSLLAVRLMNRIATFGAQLPLSAIFASPMLSSFAECVKNRLDKGESTLSVITPISRDGDLPLSFSQQRMWFLAQMEGVSETYHMPSAIRFRGDVDNPALQRTLDTIFFRHEALRSVFVNVDGHPRVRLLPPQSGIPIRHEDIRGRKDAEMELARMSTDEANTPFDLERGPLIRALMVHLDNNEHYLMLIQHHIVSDGWSMGILQRELITLYGAYSSGQSDPLPPLAIQYPDYAAWQKEILTGSQLDTLSSYWRTTLSDAPILLNLPTDQPRPLHQSFAGSHVPIMLDAHVTRRLKQLCKDHGVTLYMVILAAWSSVLSRLSGQDDIVIGSPVANRSHRQIEPLIGFFVNTLALRIDHSGDPSVKEVIDRVRRATLDAQAHQDLPFEQVVEIIQLRRSTSHSPLFQVMFAWQNNESSEWDLPGTEALETDLRYDIAKFDLDLGLYELDDTITGGIGYSTALFDHSTMERHAGYLCRMIHEMVVDLDRPIGSVEILAQDERELVLQTWNATQQDYPSHLCIHHLFEQQVERSPQATALVFNDQSMTYAELNEHSNQLAYQLIELGVQPDATVAICIERSPAMIVAVLAVLKAGGAYLPLDPIYPKDRLACILEDSKPLIVLADNTGRITLSEASDQTSHQRVMIDPNVSMDTERLNPKVPGLTSSHLAYVIYTSGSTGQPKGVMIEHHGVVNHITYRLVSQRLNESSRVLQFASLNFDASVMDIFPALSSGASLHILDNDIRRDISQIWNYIQEHSITVASLTPAALQSSKTLPQLSTPLRLSLVGEALPSSLIYTLYPLLPKGSKIINGYGPTETTILAATWNCPTEFNGDNVPIGRPNANIRIYIIDRNGHPVPLGAIGEIYIGGVGVARGYLNRPELTSQVFLQDPFSDDLNARMYKSGDLGRYLPDGNVVYLGRNDHQVKIRGFRIELGDIEARLVGHPLVKKATVVVIGEGSGKKLVAYVAAVPDDDLIHTLRSYLSSRLPDYMVPAAIVRLDTLPLTSNGKIDRKALPEPDDDAYARHVFESPQGVIETTVARIWEELLSIDKVSRNDNFFALGGHSLLAVRLMNRIATFGAQLPLSAIFASPMLSSFAECVKNRLDKGESTLSVITPISRDGDLPLSFSQQRMWFLAQMEGVSETYHMPSAIRFRGDVDNPALQRTLDTIFFRHEALRSVFVNVDGHPRVRLLPPQSGIPIRHEDIRGRKDAEMELARMSTDEANTPFDLERGPLIRALMVHLDNNEHYLMLTQHHIVSDGWSMGILQRELITLYGAYSSGQSDPLPPLAIQYPDYAAWQKEILTGSQLDTLSSYWRTTLSDAPILLNLPTDQPRPLHQSFAGSHVPIMLDSHVTRRLKQLCKDHGVTLYMVILAAWSSVLSRLSGQDDIVIGSPVANRSHRQIEPLIGFFVNTLALRIDHSGDPSVKEVIDRVRRATLDAQAHQDLPFEQVVEIIQLRRSTSHSPLFQVMFAWQNNESSEWDLPGTEALETDLRYDIAKFDLDLGLYELDDTITGGIGYSTALFDHSTMERHAGYLCRMIHEMVVDLDRPIGSVEILAQDERELVLQTWNATQQDYPSHLCIHHLFEQQVERSPQATALVFNDQSMTYAELNERSNQLAHHLIELGVRPDATVAICIERSPAMIVAVLAVIKAGGVYVPFDLTYPKDRLTTILEDSDPLIVLADDAGRTTLTEAGVQNSRQQVMIDPNVALDRPSSNPRVTGLTSCNLAYIVYTSGSTGRPKGVMIEHQGVVNYIASCLEIHGFDESSQVPLVASLSFDVSVIEIFSPLSSGGSLHILDNDTRHDISELWSYLQKHSITMAFLPPAIFHSPKTLPPLSAPLKLSVGGEHVPSSLLHTLYPLLPKGSKIINEYGPTETAIIATTWDCPIEFNGDNVPIGRPLANRRIYILDRSGHPVPLGTTGEMYIGGVGVARGYLNRPELTSEVFLRDLFVDDANARMYKTGDMARYLPDGNIVFLGRNDHQIKIRGFRIEIGEIEALLADHPLVETATVVAIGEGSDKKLVAYVVSQPNDQLAHILRSYLISCLPEYMVPAAYVRLDGLPLTSNDKVDQSRLPEPDGSSFANQFYESPHGVMEVALATIWRELLNIDKIGRHDNFFMLGGHSLMAVRMIHQIKSLMGFHINLGTLFEAPTIAELVSRLLTAGNIQEDAFDVLLPIKPRGTRPPLFCIHHGFGLSWSYIGLARHLHVDQPLYGLQARGFFNSSSQPAATVEDMALDYIDQIRRIQPHGPYHLLGYSFGCMVVHTMAAHLERQGESVALLAAMDSVPDFHSLSLEEKQEDEFEYVRLFANRLMDAMPETTKPLVARIKQTVQHLVRLGNNHSPLGCNSGMLLFRAMVQQDPSRQPISPDEWKPYVKGEIEVYDIDCDHIAMDQPGPLGEIGSVLAQKLEEIQASRQEV